MDRRKRTGLAVARFSPFVLALGWMFVEFALHPLTVHRGLLAATQGDSVLVTFIGRAFGYLMVAFLVAFVNAWLLEIVMRVRFRFSRIPFRMVVDDAGLWLWHLIPSTLPIHIPALSHPRAPPVLSLCR